MVFALLNKSSKSFLLPSSLDNKTVPKPTAPAVPPAFIAFGISYEILISEYDAFFFLKPPKEAPNKAKVLARIVLRPIGP